MSPSVLGAVPTVIGIISGREGVEVSAAPLPFQQKVSLAMCQRPWLSASRSRSSHLRSVLSKTHEDNVETVKTVNVRIKGIVQGVCYRQWTIETARHLGLDGWVRNRADGSVEAVFAGSRDTVDTMIEYCRSGPRAANVTALDVSPTRETVGKGFFMHPTA